jgi:hypothetical protein
VTHAALLLSSSLVSSEAGSFEFIIIASPECIEMDGYSRCTAKTWRKCTGRQGLTASPS